MRNKTKKNSILRGIAKYCEQFKPSKKYSKWQKIKTLLINLIVAQSCIISKIVEADARYQNSFNPDKRKKPLGKNHQVEKISKHLLCSDKPLMEKYWSAISRDLQREIRPAGNIFRDRGRMSPREILKDILLIAHDGSDLQKPYARKMKGRETLRDGSKSGNGKCYTGPGYHIEGSIAVKNDQITPMITNLYSVKEEKAYEENWYAEKKNLKTFKKYQLLRKAVHLYDRKGDDAKQLFYLYNQKIPFVTRWKEQRHLADFRDLENIKIAETAKERGRYFRGIKKHIAGMEYKEHPDYPKYEISYKQVVIEHREYIGKRNKAVFRYFPLTMIIMKFPKKKYLEEDENEKRKESKIILYTSLEVNNATEAFAVYEMYKRRWLIEVYFRFIKQTFEIEKIQVLDYKKIKNMMNYVTIASCYHHQKYYLQ